MKMTETYAATIAAVAPVIWLVAAVEGHQYIKQFEGFAKLDGGLGQARRLAEAVEGRATHEQLEAIASARRRGEEAFPRKEDIFGRIRRYVALAYLAVAMGLLSAEFMSLGWLTTPDRINEQYAAWVCLCAVVAGFVLVTIMPVVVVLLTWAAGTRKANEDYEWLVEFIEGQRNLRSEDSRQET
ncbi:hypothetical protein ACQEVY_03510 [Streptomyces sp. CA-288835]|uniref:hypothetical protein n=1 Tax=Streptomyces sp. CA-288835 TaxID=3240069 RepID=UPI003D89FFC3